MRKINKNELLESYNNIIQFTANPQNDPMGTVRSKLLSKLAYDILIGNWIKVGDITWERPWGEVFVDLGGGLHTSDRDVLSMYKNGDVDFRRERGRWQMMNVHAFVHQAQDFLSYESNDLAALAKNTIEHIKGDIHSFRYFCISKMGALNQNRDFVYKIDAHRLSEPCVTLLFEKYGDGSVKRCEIMRGSLGYAASYTPIPNFKRMDLERIIHLVERSIMTAILHERECKTN